MKVTANVLLNYIRCRRYASLNDPDYDFKLDDNKINRQYYNKIWTIFEELYLNSFEDIKQNQLISYDFHSDIELYEKLDYLCLNLETKYVYSLFSSTSKDFLKMRYNLNNRKYQMFKKDSFGVYVLKSSPKSEAISNYDEKIKKLTNRKNDLGKIVYKEAFKRFIYDKVYGLKNVKFYTVLLNTDYVYNGKNYERDLYHIFDFSKLYQNMSEIIEADIYRMINHIELNDFTEVPLVKKECRKNDTFECKFVDFCFSHIPKENSILDYFNSNRGFYEPTDSGEVFHDTYELINQGRVSMEDIPISWLKDEKHLMQRYCLEAQFIHVHKEKIETILKTLRFPLIYLDFEAMPCMLPRFKGETPFTQSVFQYSIHIQKEENILKKNGKNHYEFLANPEYDNRKELVKSLIHIINKYDSSVIVYHKTFEEQRLKEFQEYFPEYKLELQKIIDRLFDLKDVVKNNKKFFIKQGFSDYEASRYNFYSCIQSGSYSLKKVIKVFDESAYSDLTIKNGVEAYKTFMKLEILNPIDRDKAVTDLLEYCKQDTYSMFQIIQGLIKYLSPGFTIQ